MKGPNMPLELSIDRIIAACESYEWVCPCPIIFFIFERILRAFISETFDEGLYPGLRVLHLVVQLHTKRSQPV